MKRQQVLFSSDIKAIAETTAECISQMEDKVITLQELSERMGKSRQAITKLCRAGRIPFHRLGKTYYFSDKEITAYLLDKKR